jgi:hypothetical protein
MVKIIPIRPRAPKAMMGREPDFVAAGADMADVVGATGAGDDVPEATVVVGGTSSGRVVVAVLILFWLYDTGGTILTT